MLIEILISKIDGVCVSESNLHYHGSITIDEDIMDDVNLIEYQRVQVLNVNNGERIETYVIKGKRGTNVIGINGAAARKFYIGDKVLILAYGTMDFDVAKNYKPLIKTYNNSNHHFSPDWTGICLSCGKTWDEHNRTGIIHTYYDTSLLNNPTFAEAWNNKKF